MLVTANQFINDKQPSTLSSVWSHLKNTVSNTMPTKETLSRDNLSALMTKENLTSIGIGVGIKILATTALAPVGPAVFAVGALASAGTSAVLSVKSQWSADKTLKDNLRHSLTETFCRKASYKKMGKAALFGMAGVGVAELFSNVSLISSANASECVLSGNGSNLNVGNSCLNVADQSPVVTDSDLLTVTETPKPEIIVQPLEETVTQHTPIRLNPLYNTNDILSATFDPIVNSGQTIEVSIEPEPEPIELEVLDTYAVKTGGTLGQILVDHFEIDMSSATGRAELEKALAVVYDSPENCFTDLWQLNGILPGQEITIPDINTETNTKVSLSELAKDTSDGGGPSVYYQGNICKVPTPVMM